MIAEPVPARRVLLYSSHEPTPGVPCSIGSRRFRQIKALIKSRQAKWLVPGVSAQLLHKTDAEVAASISETCYDTCPHPGAWRVIQPANRSGGFKSGSPNARYEFSRREIER
jgi:hypothetical protein